MRGIEEVIAFIYLNISYTHSLSLFVSYSRLIGCRTVEQLYNIARCQLIVALASVIPGIANLPTQF